MADFDYNRRDSGARPRLGLWTLAGVAGIVAVGGVVGANVLSRLLERGEIPVIAFIHPDQGMKRLANSAPSPQAPQTVTIVRSVGVDGVTTATIPHPPAGGQPLSPCGEGRK
jgi:hypothetical protein